MSKKFILILLVIGFIFPLFSLAQTVGPIQQPKTPEEVKQMAQKGVTLATHQLPGILKQIWDNDAVPVWNKMWDWTIKNIWTDYTKKKLSDFWYQTSKPKIQAILDQLKGTFEKNKPIINEEFQKSKDQMRKEIPSTTQSIWQKLQNLMK